MSLAVLGCGLFCLERLVGCEVVGMSEEKFWIALVVYSVLFWTALVVYSILSFVCVSLTLGRLLGI